MAAKINIDLKKIDEDTKLVVHGYVHDIQKTIKSVIPADIIILCICFYHMGEYFLKAGWSYVISSDNRCITRITHQVDGDGSAIGNVVIPSKHHGVHMWNFKILSKKGECDIGLVSNDYNDPDDDYNYYEYQTATIKWGEEDTLPSGGGFWNYSRVPTKIAQFKKGDTVQMRLLSDKTKIQFHRNNVVISNMRVKSNHISTRLNTDLDIDDCTEWRMFVMARQKYSQIKLLKYSYASSFIDKQSERFVD